MHFVLSESYLNSCATGEYCVCLLYPWLMEWSGRACPVTCITQTPLTLALQNLTKRFLASALELTMDQNS